jgi:hypothetical protein
MADSYLLILSDGTFDQKIEGDAIVFDHGLTFTGRGVTSYGEVRNENILHMVENFANVSAPTNPLTGQLWYDTGSGTLLVWNGGSWTSVTSDNYVVGGTYSVNDLTGEINLTRDSGGPVVIQNAASETNINNHISDATDAHDGTAISFVPNGSIPSNNAQGAIEDVEENIDDHVTDTVDAHDASAISFVPYGSFGSTDVQDAIEEAEDEVNSINSSVSASSSSTSSHIADSVDAHDASAISFSNGGTGLSATDVQDAIDEINSNISTAGAVGTLRVRPSATQAIGTTATLLTFNITDYGDLSADWNGTNTYTAGFDQEVNVKLSVSFGMRNNATGEMQIRVGGSTVRSHQVSNYDNDSGASSVSISRTNEIGVKLRLTSGQQVRFYMFLTPADGIHSTGYLNTATHAEFEVVRVL